MADIDYTIYYRTSLAPAGDWHEKASCDVFLSAYNSSDRVNCTFSKVTAPEKHWLIHPEYQYDAQEYPDTGRVFAPKSANEADFIQEYMATSDIDFARATVGVDITGFMRPPLMFLIRAFMTAGLKRFDALYSEPLTYDKKENTRFSDEQVFEVRQVAGYEGNHAANVSNDVLIIGSGYDHELVVHVAEHKENAKKVQLLGLPSLRADMYQENVLRASRAANAIGGERETVRNYFAPANNPFVTAAVLREIVSELTKRQAITNLYLSPLATKPQALGFAIYYVTEWLGKEASIIFPFCRTYSRETSKGIARIWKYTVELPNSTF